MAEFFRYFKNEKENPFHNDDSDKRALWNYEECYKYNGDNENLISEYRHFLKDFKKNDGIPEGYKALLFNRYMKGAGDIERALDDFKRFYEKYYG